MALHTLGTNANTSLTCLPAWSAVISEGDVGQLASNILNDAGITSILGGYSSGQTYFVGTGSTHTNTTLDSVATSAGPAIGTIKVGDVVLGAGIPAGTYVAAIAAGGATLTLSRATTATAAGVHIIIAHPALMAPKLEVNSALLYVPMRGTLTILPGDYVATGKAGEVILVPGNAVGYAGSVWHFS